MKILLTVEFYEPHKGGAQEVVKQLAERLAGHGHDVSVATTYLPDRKNFLLNGVKIIDFKISGNTVRGYQATAAEISRYQKVLSNSGWNTIINYAAQVWTTDLMFPILDQLKTRKILVPCGYSGLNNPTYADYFKKLPASLAQYDKLVYLSENYQDRLFGIKHGFADKAVIIPNGAATEEFLGPPTNDIKKELAITTPYLLITVATHHRDKGHSFVIEAFKRLNRSDSTLLIIGENPGTSWLQRLRHFFTGCYKTCWYNSLINPRIKLLGGSDRKRVVSAYKQADLFLLGSKVECAPLVMYESFAAGVPFISTKVGNVPDYPRLVSLINTPHEMAAVTNNLLNDREKRKDIRSESVTLWQDQYTWDTITEQYESIIGN
ncbi:MAG: glycosyltransferase family 4 protein [bacterium]